MIKCKNCDNLFEGKYCNNCGQKQYTDKDKSVGLLFQEVFHFLTHFEGTFLTTLKTILFRPGKLSQDYSEGIRKKYFKPVSMFLFSVILYLFLPVFVGLNMKMEYYMAIPFSGPYITRQIEQKENVEKLSVENLSEKFRQSSEKVSKILLFLLVLVTSALLYFLFFSFKRYAFDNMILATEINIFYILVFFIAFSVPLLPFLKMSGQRLSPYYGERIASAVILVCFAVYSALVFRKIFKQKWVYCLLKGLIFAVLHGTVLIFLYRPLVFEVTYILI